MKISSEKFGIIDDEEIQIYTLKNEHGIEVKLTNYGGIIGSVKTPDKDGNFKNIVLGFDTLQEYVGKNYLASYPYFGAIIGRFGNRIANGVFKLDGKKYTLDVNNGPNHLHGGLKGFDKVVWKASSFRNNIGIGVKMKHRSTDGDQGYPGNLDVSISYMLSNQNELILEYNAQTDQATPINITNHSYFNLGDGKTILDHLLQLNSKFYNEMNSDAIPTGKLLSVENTPFDFRKMKGFKDNIDEFEHGYDNNFMLDNIEGECLKAGELFHEKSGRVVEVFTTEVGIQVYTGKHNPELNINGTSKFGPYSGVALETQHYPDSPNHDNFPNSILRPGDTYNQKTIYKFSVRP